MLSLFNNKPYKIQTSVSFYLVPTSKVVAFCIYLTCPQIICISKKSLKVTSLFCSTLPLQSTGISHKRQGPKQTDIMQALEVKT